MTGGRMEIMYVPAGAIGRLQVSDTHMHTYVGAHAHAQARSHTHMHTRMHNNNNRDERCCRFCEFECVQGKVQAFVEGERVGV
jgi:hypothetical protein